MNLFLFIEINVVCLFILALLFINLHRTSYMNTDEKLFQDMIISLAVMLIFDTICWIADGSTAGWSGVLNLWANALYFFQTVLVCFVWVLYTDYKVEQDMSALKRRLPVYLIPLAVNTVFAFASPFTEWLYYIDSLGNYHRGKMYFVQAFISWAYLVYTAVFALVKSHKEAQSFRKSECRLIAIFIIFPIAGSVIQTLFYGIPLLWVSVTCALLMLFINIQTQQISIDDLTKVANRGQLNKYLATKTAGLKSDENVYLILIDIDAFKEINDTYGHAVGDSALIDVANILKAACSRTDTLVARYGGDEFAVVMQNGGESKIAQLLEKIREETEQVNSLQKNLYTLSISVGYAEYDREEIDTVDKLIAEADRQMYIHKKKR